MSWVAPETLASLPSVYRSPLLSLPPYLRRRRRRLSMHALSLACHLHACPHLGLSSLRRLRAGTSSVTLSRRDELLRLRIWCSGLDSCPGLCREECGRWNPSPRRLHSYFDRICKFLILWEHISERRRRPARVARGSQPSNSWLEHSDAS